MKNALQVTGWFLLGLLLLFLAAGLTLGFDRLTRPFSVQTDRKAYTESQAYNDGMAVDLDKYCREYRQATDAGVKAALADTIRLRSARYTGTLPTHIQGCLNEIR